MPRDILKIVIGRDGLGWYRRFSEAVERLSDAEHPIECIVVDLDASRWQQAAAQGDVILWMPGYMGPRSAVILKEKVFFLERHLKKLVVPNFETIWHFESKVAQSYLFDHYAIPTPVTVATHCSDDATERLKQARFPLVFKKPHGASSMNVEMVADAKHATRLLERAFAQDRWDDAKRHSEGHRLPLLPAVTRRWFWEKVRRKLTNDERHGVAYWQEYVSGNDADLRITAIGDMFAVGFWRRNRPGDFRASGSGLIDYERPVPAEAVEFCLDLNRRMSFDSMAYDIVFDNDRPVILEMSYAYIDEAVWRAPGHFERRGADVVYADGHVWPQELWVRWALHRAEVELGW